MNMKTRELRYKGKVYNSLKKLCTENDISYAGLAMYTVRRSGKKLLELSDEDIMCYLLKYIELKERGYGKYKHNLDNDITVNGVKYNSLKDMYKDLGINNNFRRYCILNTGVTASKLKSDVIETLVNKYINMHKENGDIKLLYNGVTYRSITEACKKENVSSPEFRDYCMMEYDIQPQYIGEKVSEVFSEFVAYVERSRNKRLQDLYGTKVDEVKSRVALKKMSITYNGVDYKSISDACSKVCKSEYAQFARYCYNAIGVLPTKIYEDDIRNNMFAKYADYQGISSISSLGCLIEYNGVLYNSIKEACMSLWVEYGGFSSYCITNYKMQPKMMSKEGINKAFDGYLNLKNAKGDGK